MIKIIDTTLTTLDHHLPSKEDLHLFCQLLKNIGVDNIVISPFAYKVMEYLPEGIQFFLQIELLGEKVKYPGFYRYLLYHADNEMSVVSKIQINDIREIISLRAFKNLEEVCIVGLDDLICHNYNQEMKEIKEALPKSKIIFCPENTHGCASALGVQWILNGGNQVMTSFTGYANKAATEEVLLALRLAVRHKPNRDLKDLTTLTKLFEKITHKTLSKKKPIVGKDIFKVEAGIHADGILKNPTNYEPFDPKIVGKETAIIIGKHSGKKAIKLKCIQNKIRIPNDNVIVKILEEIQRVCTLERKSLTEEEFVVIVDEVCAYEKEKKDY